MNRWFLKGNARRFYRIDMPLNVFVIPKTSIQDAEIFATGADYFPPSVTREIEEITGKTHYWIDLIQEQKERIIPLFNEAISDIEFFGSCVERISLGLDPRNKMDYWTRINKIQKGFTVLSTIEKSAPKTFAYFKLIEEKYLFFLNSLITAIQNSTPDTFAADTNIPVGFKLDELLSRFANEKFDRIPLIQSLANLGRLITAYTNVYRHITDDNYLKLFPKQWPTYQVNVSASGIAMQLPKRYKQYDKLDIHIYIPSTDSVLHFDGMVVDIRTFDNIYKERVAINFEFPDGKNQNQLQNEIQKYEIKECFEIKL